jgi:hypothetical protein
MDASTDASSDAPALISQGGLNRKALLWIGGVTLALWAFAINTGSRWVMGIVGVLTLVLVGVLLWAFRMLRKQRGVVSLLQGATTSPEARRDALAKLSEGKDAKSPTNVFARAQLQASDDPKAALALLGTVELTAYPPAMQDDVSLLKTQLCLNLGRTQDARKSADVMNLDNPARKEIRPLAASIVAEAWARTGKSKEALALLDSIELPKKDAEQISIQMKVARVFARFASNNRNAARAEMAALADVDLNHLGRFLMPQFRVHPELQQLAKRVLEQHPAGRKMAKANARRR